MKLCPPLKAFLNAVETTAPAVATRSTVPALQCIKIEALNGSLYLHATDNDISVSAEVSEVPIQTEGVACVMASQLSGIVRAVEGDDVFLELKGDTLNVTAGEDKFSLQTHDPKTFPTRKVNEKGIEWEFDGAKFSRQIARARYGIRDTEHKSFTLDGLYLDLKSGKVTCSSTDSKVCSRVREDAVVEGEAWGQILPADVLPILARLNAGPIRFLGTDNEAVFSGEGVTISTRLISGRYPPYDKIFDVKKTVPVVVPAAGLIAACKKAKLMATEEETLAVFTFRAGRIDLEIGTGRGRCTTSVFGVGYDGDERVLNLSPDAVMKTAVSSQSESLAVRIGEWNQPVMFETADGFAGLVMPMEKRGEKS